MKRLAPVLIAAAAVFGLSACSSTPYAAKVDGVTISSSIIDDEVHAITSNPAYADAINTQLSSNGGLRPGGANTVNSQYTASLLYDRVLSVLIDKQLRADKLTVSDATRNSTRDALRSQSPDPSLFDNLASSYRDYIVEAQAGLQTILDARSTPAAQQKYYADNISTYSNVCIRQMTVADEASGATIKSQLQAGGDFAALAQAAATAAGTQYDPSLTEPQCVAETDLSDYAKSVLNPLPINGVSDPLQTSSGYALVQLTSRTTQPFADVQATIQSTLANKDALFTELLSKASVKVNPKYGTYTPADASTGAVAAIKPHTPVVLSEDAQTSTAGSGAGGDALSQLDPSAASGSATSGGASSADSSAASSAARQ